MKVKSTPDYGTTRTRKVFLWLPRKFYIYEKRDNVTKCWGKSETLWLETVEIDEEWREVGYPRDGIDYWQQTDYRRLK